MTSNMSLSIMELIVDEIIKKWELEILKNKEKSLSPLSKRMAGSVQGNGLANRTYNPSSSSTNLMGIFDTVTAKVLSFGRGNYVPRGRGGYNQNYNNGHSRPRYFHYKSSGRDPRDSGSYYSNASVGRYDKRPRSPRDDHDESPMRKVNAEKQRIDRMIEKHPSGPLSEGEERDDEDGELH
ncbi:uncharacterized protein LOC113465903 [Diaphorina citri]|uniref:Uncharacterized protein LOC113465903 n=1 Tax=Diaphorina citri TaxID=121845 RepID=A0A3Q0IQN4_DIACI|nr:uncharacterized protein LOC113465903 [Diaphorina citri]